MVTIDRSQPCDILSHRPPRGRPDTLDAAGIVASPVLLALRRVWLRIHRWIGLVLGAVLALIGVTGSVLVFHQEIDEWMYPALLHVTRPTPEAPMQSIGAMVRAARARLPDGARVEFIYLPRHAEAAAKCGYSLPRPDGPQPDEWLAYVNPYTAEVTGTRLWYSGRSWLENPFVPFMFKLHYALLVWRYGAPVVGVLSVFVLVSLLSGLYLWWPLNGSWSRAVRLRRPLASWRGNLDIHTFAGLVLLPVLVVLFVTGIYFNLPVLVTAPLGAVATIEPAQTIRSQNTPWAQAVDVDRAIAQALERYPGDRVQYVTLPLRPGDAYQVSQLVDLRLGVRMARASFVDQYSGEVIAVRDGLSRPARTAVLQWAYILHSGEAWSWFGRLLVFVGGLVCPLLVATGAARWWQKRRAARRARERRGTRTGGAA